MKKLLIMALLAAAGANASELINSQTAYCTYQDADGMYQRSEFVVVNVDSLNYSSTYRATLSEKLIVELKELASWGRFYYMTLNYNQGELILQESSHSFSQAVAVNLEGSVGGRDFRCHFTPNQ